MKRTIASAKVLVTLEIQVPDSWGDNCTVDQIYKQAAESAVGLLRTEKLHDRVRLVGEPKVTAVLAEPMR